MNGKQSHDFIFVFKKRYSVSPFAHLYITSFLTLTLSLSLSRTQQVFLYISVTLRRFTIKQNQMAILLFIGGEHASTSNGQPRHEQRNPDLVIGDDQAIS